MLEAGNSASRCFGILHLRIERNNPDMHTRVSVDVHYTGRSVPHLFHIHATLSIGTETEVGTLQ